MINAELRKTEEIISSGGIILYPTDTIWGIGCDATNPEAVERIYKIKQRSDSKSMLVLVSGIEMLSSYLKTIPEKALEIIKTTTNPTTIIYPNARNLAPNLIAKDGSAGIRISSDPFCKELTERLGHPIVSTSANISGSTPPGVFREITPIMVQQVDYVVNLRQDEITSRAVSTILLLDREGNIKVIRA